MAKQFELQSVNYKAIEVVVAADVVAGEHATEGVLNGFYFTDADSGDTATLITEAEMVKVVKTAAQVWAEGVAIYVITATDVCTTTATSNTLVGYAQKTAASADTEGWIQFDGTLAYAKA